MPSDKGVKKCGKRGLKKLHSAAFFGRIKAVQELLSSGVDINTVDQNEGNTALHFAVKSHRNKVIQLLLGNHADLNVRNKALQTPLLIAVKKRQPRSVKRLIASGAAANIADEAGNTPLHIALSYGYDELVKLLLEYGADISLRNQASQTPLDAAIFSGRVSQAESLYQEFIKPKDLPEKMALWEETIKYDQLKTATFLLEKKPAFKHHADYSSSYMSLHSAVEAGNFEKVYCLIKSGVHINEPDTKGNTPLHVAAIYGKEKIVELLLDNHATINACNEASETPLFLAVEKEQSSTVKCLIQKGADVDIADKAGNTPLGRAMELNSPEVVEWLWDNSRDSKIERLRLLMLNKKVDKVFIMNAVEKGWWGIIGFLLKKDAIIKDYAASRGLTLAHFAANAGQCAVAELLIEREVDMNKLDHQENNPLFFAVLNNDVEMVRLLYPINLKRLD